VIGTDRTDEPTTRQVIIDRVNEFLGDRGTLTAKHWGRVVRIARYHQLATAEEIVEAHRSRRLPKAVRS
jgi:hypothetical protein